MKLYPAIDIRDGRCVRLHQGDYAWETVYSDDPVAQAHSFEAAGADWIHVVDLDAARSGEPENRQVVSAIVAGVSVPVQAGGGVRSEASADALFAAGVERVVIGTAALRDPDLVLAVARDHRVAVGIDARAGDVATDGWEQSSGRSVIEVAQSFADAGVEALIVTDIGRDGTLSGPDIEGLTDLLKSTDIDVIASGGVSGLADLLALSDVEERGRRLSGAIVGRAIYEGHLDVAEAIEALARGGRR